MSITLILGIVVAITAIVLVTLIVGLKKVFDKLEYVDAELKNRDKSVLEYQDLMKSFFENKSNEIKNELSIEIKQLLEKSQLKFEELSTLSKDNSTSLEKEFKNLITSLQNELQTSIKSIENTSKTLADNIVETVIKQSENILVQNKESNNSSKELLITSFEGLTNKVAESSNATIKNINKYLEVQDKNVIDIKTKLANNYENILQLVNNLRLDNLINVSNEIGKYKEGIYEDEHFKQEVGHCRVIKLTDKNSGEVTNVHYNENGEKLYTETYIDEALLYKMNYEDGKLRNGIEFNKNGDSLFEYFYDDAEEINKKVEYIYDENFTLTEKKDTNY